MKTMIAMTFIDEKKDSASAKDLTLRALIPKITKAKNAAKSKPELMETNVASTWQHREILFPGYRPTNPIKPSYRKAGSRTDKFSSIGVKGSRYWHGNS